MSGVALWIITENKFCGKHIIIVLFSKIVFTDEFHFSELKNPSGRDMKRFSGFGAHF